MAGFFKKLAEQVKKSCPELGDIAKSDSIKKLKQKINDFVAEATGFGTPSYQQSYGSMLVEEQEQRAKLYNERQERLKTVYRDPADIEIVADARSRINARIKDNLRPRNFLWGAKEVLDELAEYIVDNSEKDLGEICAYIESQGVRYDRAMMEEEINAFRGHSMLYIFRREKIEEYVFLDRMDADEIMQLIDDDERQMEEIRNRP